jgi:hypothetical protein
VQYCRGWISHLDALAQTLVTLRFFLKSPQDSELDGTGHQSFNYHFLDMHTVQRVWQCELSTIDTTILLSGMLVAAQFFNQTRQVKQKLAVGKAAHPAHGLELGTE